MITTEPKFTSAHAACIELMPRLRRFAQYLVPSDPHTQDDLTQEMAVAILQVKGDHTRAFFLILACWRARDYLRRERKRAMVSIESLFREVSEDDQDLLDAMQREVQR